MSCNLIKEKIIQLTALYKQYESVVDDLQSSIFNHLNELNLELNLDFITFERARKYTEDKETIFNFLRKSGFDYEIACKALENNLRWRIDNRVDNISINDIHPSLLEIGLFYFHKTDKFGRPCAILNLREYAKKDNNDNNDNNMSLSPVSIDDVKKFIIFNVEVSRRLLLDKRNSSCSKKDNMILQYVILLDLKGAGVSTLNLELIPFLIDIARNHFPGFIGSIFVLNYGWVYSGIWQIFKRVLPEESLSRIHFPSSNKELLDYFEKDDLLPEHGGNDDYEYDIKNYEVYQSYGRPCSVLSLPKTLYRVASFDSTHDTFFTPYSTPYSSRPPTPNHDIGNNNISSSITNGRPPFKYRSSSSSSRPPSRPQSPGITINHHHTNDISNNNNNNNNNNVHVPSWLAMTPKSLSMTHNSNINNNDNVVLSPKPIKPILTNNHLPNDNNDNASNLHVNFQIDYFSHNRHLHNNNYNNVNNDHHRCRHEKEGEEMEEENYFQNTTITTTNHHYSQSNLIMNKGEKNYPFSSIFSHIPSSSTTDDFIYPYTAATGLSLTKSKLYKLTKIHTSIKTYFERLMYKLVSRRITGVLYYVMMFVILRGGLFNEFWKIVTRRTFSS